MASTKTGMKKPPSETAAVQDAVERRDEGDRLAALYGLTPKVESAIAAAVADGADAEMDALESLTDPRAAVVPESMADALTGVVPGAAGGGRAELVSFTPDRQTYQVQTPAEGLLVFSEIHYPEGWSITIDGEPAEMLRVNYAFRAVVVPQGNHEVEMAFDVPAVGTARTVASAGSVLILLALLGSLWAALTGRGTVEEEA